MPPSPADHRHRPLGISIGMPGPHDFNARERPRTRSPPASRRNAARDRSTSLVLTTPSQPPHPAPRLVTTRTPLLPGRNVADQTPDLGGESREFLKNGSHVYSGTQRRCRCLPTPHQNSPKPPSEVALIRNPFVVISRADTLELMQNPTVTVAHTIVSHLISVIGGAPCATPALHGRFSTRADFWLAPGPLSRYQMPAALMRAVSVSRQATHSTDRFDPEECRTRCP